jgi:flagellar hook-associated protein 3 FlgL
MRVTENMVYSTYIQDILKHQRSLFKLHEQLSSGKAVNSLSDDPVNAGRILRGKSTIAAFDQYTRNSETGLTYLSISESTMERVKSIIIRAKEISISEATGTAGSASRQNAAFEVNQLYSEIIALGNKSYQGSYMFGGYESGTEPFSTIGVYSGDTAEYAIQVGQDKTLAIGINGGKVLKGVGGNIDIVQAIEDLQTALNANDTTGIQSAVADMDTSFEQVSLAVSDIGGRISRLNATLADLESSKLNVQISLSVVEDADITQVISDLTRRQTALEAAIISASKIFRLSIFNYI